MKILSSLSESPTFLAHLARYPESEHNPLVSQWNIDGNDDGTLDRDEWRRDWAFHPETGTKRHQVSHKGLVQLDWEGVMSLALKFPENNPNFELAITELVAGLHWFGDVFPNAQFYYYNIAIIRRWWDVSDGFIAYHFRLVTELMKAKRADGTQLLGALQVVCYIDEETPILSRYAKTIEVAISFGQHFNLPVYLQLWDRFQDSNPVVGFHRMDDVIYTDWIRALASVEKNGHKVDGYAPWSGLNHYLNVYFATNADGSYKLKGTLANRRRAGLTHSDVKPMTEQGVNQQKWVDDVHMNTLDIVAETLNIDINPPTQEPPTIDFEAILLSTALAAERFALDEAMNSMNLAAAELHAHLTRGA